MKYEVYSITCLVNEKVYFGRSQETEKRWRSHKNSLRRGIHNNLSLQRDWTEYGEENFTFVVLHSVDSCEEAEKLEQEYIDSLLFVKYNISNAKMGGDTFSNNPRSESTRKLKSINAAGERNPMYGKEKSELMINRVKEANSKKISINGIVYSSLTEASNKLNIGVTTVNYRLKSQSQNFTEWFYV